ncbi:MAG: hypothetical protein AAGF11_13840 [Myxococcota bacterium]
MPHRLFSLTRASALIGAITVAGGCMSLSPQLRPTDFETLETYSDRAQREQAYADNAIYVHDEPQGTRYTKGTSVRATKRSWQSLDAILRSDASASAALPKRDMRISRVFTALTVVAGILTVAGTAASAREGLDLQNLNGTGGLLLGSGLAAVGFGITAGVFYGKTKKGYERAVDIYNDSLAVRLGLNTPSGDYIPPEGVLVDKDGFIVLDERERAEEDDAPADPDPGAGAGAPALPSEAGPGPASTPAPAPAPAEVAPSGAPALPSETAPTQTAPTESAPPQTPPLQSPTTVTPTTSGTSGSTAAPYDGGALELMPR